MNNAYPRTIKQMIYWGMATFLSLAAAASSIDAAGCDGVTACQTPNIASLPIWSVGFSRIYNLSIGNSENALVPNAEGTRYWMMAVDADYGDRLASNDSRLSEDRFTGRRVRLESPFEAGPSPTSGDQMQLPSPISIHGLVDNHRYYVYAQACRPSVASGTSSPDGKLCSPWVRARSVQTVSLGLQYDVASVQSTQGTVRFELTNLAALNGTTALSHRYRVSRVLNPSRVGGNIMESDNVEFSISGDESVGISNVPIVRTHSALDRRPNTLYAIQIIVMEDGNPSAPLPLIEPQSGAGPFVFGPTVLFNTTPGRVQKYLIAPDTPTSPPSVKGALIATTELISGHVLDLEGNPTGLYPPTDVTAPINDNHRTRYAMERCPAEDPFGSPSCRGNTSGIGVNPGVTDASLNLPSSPTAIRQAAVNFIGDFQPRRRYHVRVKVQNYFGDNGRKIGTPVAIDRTAPNFGDSAWEDLGEIETPPTEPFTMTVDENAMGGYRLDNNLICIPKNAPIPLIFNRELYEIKPDHIVLEKDAYSQNPRPARLTVNVRYNSLDPAKRAEIVPPPDGWPSSPLRIRIPHDALFDLFRLSPNQDKDLSFVPAPDPSKEEIVVPFLDGNEISTQLRLPANTVPAGTCIAIRSELKNPSNRTAAGVPVGSPQLPAGSKGLSVTDKKLEIVQIRNQQLVDATFNAAPLQLDLRHFGLESAQLARLENDLLIPVDTHINGSLMVAPAITQPAVYFLVAQVPTTELDQMIVYPNPYKSNQGVGGVTFKNLGANAEIRIFTLAGEKVYRYKAGTFQTEHLWPVVNSSGERVASGAYFYIVETATAKRTGKIFVIQ